MPTVIARYSDEGSDYASGMYFASSDRDLREARTRAEARNLHWTLK